MQHLVTFRKIAKFSIIRKKFFQSTSSELNIRIRLNLTRFLSTFYLVDSPVQTRFPDQCLSLTNSYLFSFIRYEIFVILVFNHCSLIIYLHLFIKQLFTLLFAVRFFYSLYSLFQILKLRDEKLQFLNSLLDATFRFNERTIIKYVLINLNTNYLQVQFYEL